jgi:hypothetical protein
MYVISLLFDTDMFIIIIIYISHKSYTRVEKTYINKYKMPVLVLILQNASTVFTECQNCFYRMSSLVFTEYLKY